MPSHRFSIYIALLLLVSATTQQNCGIPSLYDKIQSGNLYLVNKGLQQRIHTFNAPVDNFEVFSQTYQTAVSPMNIGNFNQLSGIDFLVSGGKQGSNPGLVIYLVVSQDQRWSDMRISYLVTYSQSIIIDTIFANTYQTSGFASPINNLGIARTYIPKQKLSKNVKFNIKVFISGIKSSSSNFAVFVNNSIIVPETGECLITFNINNPKLEFVQFTYIIYPEIHPDFIFDASTGTYQFQGLSSLANNDINYDDFKICKKAIAVTCKQNQIFINGQCLCRNGYTRIQENCRQLCKSSTGYINQNNVCICLPGFIQISGGQCVNANFTNCGKNQVRVGPICACLRGYNLDGNGNCVSVECKQNQLLSNGECICKPRYSKNQQGFCVIFSITRNCGNNQYYDQQRGLCLCNGGYEKNSNGICVLIAANCGQNQQRINGVCQCRSGFYKNNGRCIRAPTCPSRAYFDQNTLSCRCSSNNQFLINGRCQSCPQNEQWNGVSCVCRTNYFRIRGICRLCDPQSTYDGDTCKCNQGYFGTGEKCQLCHQTCGSCLGPNSNQCTRCVDISYQLKDGTCTRDILCPLGSYLDNNNKTCQLCQAYCQKCSNQFDCERCAPGFNLNTQQAGSVTLSYCTSICGDGRRYQIQQCDDNNTRNGDGCNSQCKIETGWSCSGGSSVQSSTCVNRLPKKTQIILKGAVQLFGKVVQSIKLSYIPTCFTDLQCQDCYRILNVKVVESAVPIVILINYLPNSEGQFLVQFNFQGLTLAPAFTFTVEINKNLPEKYKGCFSQQDLSQKLTKFLDPALLIKKQSTDTLTLEDLDTINISDDIVDYLVKTPPV